MRCGESLMASGFLLCAPRREMLAHPAMVRLPQNQVWGDSDRPALPQPLVASDLSTLCRLLLFVLSVPAGAGETALSVFTTV